LKILQIVQTLDPTVGGVAPAVMGLSRGLVGRDHEVDILTLDKAGAPYLSGSALPVIALGPGLTRYRYSKRIGDWLREKGRDYDRVLVHGLWQYLGYAAWRRFSGSGTPYYVFPHGMLDPWFKRTFPLKHLKKWLYWPWAEYRVLRDAAAVIFTSEQERLEAKKSFWLYRCREKVSPLGVEPLPPISLQAKELFIERFPQLRNTRVLLFFGRLHPKKGCDLLIEAWARYSGPKNGISIVLAGPDQIGWAEQLRVRAANFNVAGQIVFTGMLEGEMKQGAFQSADAFILPSHQENFGMAVVEALAAGLPVLISNRVNIWREIHADHAGHVENDDLPGTIRLIERWLSMSSAEIETMRANAISCFARRFQIDRAVDSLLQILSEPRDAA
jgi:glycosyltransferase involved in cell wall biosynthesis